MRETEISGEIIKVTATKRKYTRQDFRGKIATDMKKLELVSIDCRPHLGNMTLTLIKQWVEGMIRLSKTELKEFWGSMDSVSRMEGQILQHFCPHLDRTILQGKMVRWKKKKLRDIITTKRIRTGSIVVRKEPWPSPS